MMRGALALWMGSVVVGCAANGVGPEEAFSALEQERPYDFHRSMAVSLLKTGQPSAALKHVNQLLKAEPEKADPHFLKGNALLDLGQYDEAEKALNVAIELNPELASAQSLLGVALDSMGDHVAAERAHREAVRLAADEAGYYNNLGFGLYLQKRYRDAIEVLGKGLEKDPTNNKIHNNLGFAYAAIDDLDLAYRHFNHAGGAAMAENNLGFVLERKGQRDAACDRYAKAVAEDQKLAVARENLGRLCVPVTPEGGAY